MKKHILISIIAALTGILIGVPLAIQNATKPMIVQQISEILKGQKKLEARLTAIERQQKFIADIFRRFDTGPAQPNRQRPTPSSEDFDKQYSLPLEHSPFRGRANAPVTITEFVDLQCPFCKRFHPAVNEVLKAYPDQVKYVAKHFPLVSIHPQAKPAAKAAFAAGEQGKYWEMAELLLENGARLSEAKFEEFAGQLGLDVDQFKKDYQDKDAQWENYIRKDMALGASVGVRGTPTFFLNGKKTRARTLEAFKVEIDEILDQKK